MIYKPMTNEMPARSAPENIAGAVKDRPGPPFGKLCVRGLAGWKAVEGECIRAQRSKNESFQ